MADRVGQRFGNYILTHLLGKGGFAEVYRGEHIYLKSAAAIKVLLTQLGEDEIARFLAEARTLAGLKHPHIVHILDFGMEGDIPFIVMEYAPNGTMRRRYPRGTPLDINIIVPYVKQIASALQYAHEQKLIHRDIKPENMLLQKNNDILLSDFGVAVIAQSTYQHSREEVAGTANYMAPEQIRGKARQSSDQYALGVVVYEWLTGDHLFKGSFMEVCAQHMFAPPEPIRARIPTVSPEIEQAVMIALTKDPSQRFASIQAFATALEQASRFEQAITYTPASQPADHQPFLFSNEANRTIPYHSDTSIQRPVLQASTFRPDFPSDMQQAEGVILYQSSLPDGRHKSALMGEVTSQADSSLASSASGSGSLATSPGSSLQIRLPQRLRSPMSLLALCVVLVLVFVMGGSGLFYYIYATTNRPGPITSVVQPTPTSNLLARGPLAYSSTLSAQDSGQWDVFNFENNGYCRFDNNSYHIYMPSGNNYIVTCFAQRTNFSGNFTMEASMTLNQGFMIGVAFRANENNHYRFRISPDGSWDLVDNQGSQIAQGNSNAIKGLGQSNTLKVIARGTTFYLYINGQFVKQAIANTASGGMIGLFTVSSPTQTADARFSSISVWQP